MMKLTLMRDVSATVDAEWHSPIADAILAQWAHDDERAWFVRSSANILFGFKQARQVCFLRFNHAGERTTEMIQAELDYLAHLHAAGLRVVQPIRSLAGNFIESVETGLGRFHAVAFERVPGEMLDIDALTPAQVTAWGQSLGELHQAGLGYNAVGRPTWRDQIESLEADLPAHETTARQAAQLLHRQLAQLPINTHQAKDNYGLIHFDFEMDNLLWDGERFGLIDFDDCIWHWHVADIAGALGGDLFDDDPAQVDLQNPTFNTFVAGYRQAKAIRNEDLDQMPLFLRLHNLVAFAKLLRAMDAGDAADDPTWLKDLRQKLTRKLDRYRVGFADHPPVAPKSA
jgi:Ser/Thr protein kinase RdoA (MazF antagonist)